MTQKKQTSRISKMTDIEYSDRGVVEAIAHFKYIKQKTGYAFTILFKDGQHYMLLDVKIDLTPVMEYLKINRIKTK